MGKLATETADTLFDDSLFMESVSGSRRNEDEYLQYLTTVFPGKLEYLNYIVNVVTMRRRLGEDGLCKYGAEGMLLDICARRLCDLYQYGIYLSRYMQESEFRKKVRTVPEYFKRMVDARIEFILCFETYQAGDVHLDYQMLYTLYQYKSSDDMDVVKNILEKPLRAYEGMLRAILTMEKMAAKRFPYFDEIIRNSQAYLPEWFKERVMDEDREGKRKRRQFERQEKRGKKNTGADDNALFADTDMCINMSMQMHT